MKVLAVNGSPHSNGVTFTAMKLVADTLASEGIATEFVQVGAIPLRGCTDCLMCRKSGNFRCVVDDMVNEAIEKLEDCDGILLGAPTYFCGIPGPAKTFLDRFFYASQMTRAMHFKAGASVTALRRSGGVTALHQLNNYLMPSHIVMVPSQYHNGLFGKSPEEAMRDEEGVQTLKMLGRNMAWLMKSLQYAKEACPPPEFTERIRTNFPGNRTENYREGTK